MSVTISITNIPNDTFAFGPWILDKIGEAPKISSVKYKDIETINKEVLQDNADDICKVSFNTLPDILDNYVVLTTGSAVVKNTGPKIVSKYKEIDFSKASIAIPGKNTTAYLLTEGLLPKFKEIKEMNYSNVLPSIRSGEYDCGLLIHESSFQIKESGLQEVCNLADLWQQETNNLPLPLGGIVAKRSLGKEAISFVTKSIQKSILYSQQHFSEVESFIKKQSDNKDIDVIKKGIDFWVNDETYSISEDGKKSIQHIFDMACSCGSKRPRRSDILHL